MFGKRGVIEVIGSPAALLCVRKRVSKDIKPAR